MMMHEDNHGGMLLLLLLQGPQDQDVPQPRLPISSKEKLVMLGISFILRN